MTQNQDIAPQPETMEDDIRLIAHKMWEDEGKPEGLAEVHWAKACAMVAAEFDNKAEAPNWLQKSPAAEISVTTLQDVEDGSLAHSIEQLKKRVAGRSAA